MNQDFKEALLAATPDSEADPRDQSFREPDAAQVTTQTHVPALDKGIPALAPGAAAMPDKKLNPQEQENTAAKLQKVQALRPLC